MAQNPNPSQLDPGQIIKRAFNEANDTVRVEGSISVAELAVDEIGQPIGTEVKLAGGVDGNGDAQALAVDADGQLQVDVLTSTLPTGAATEAKQDTANTSLASIDSKLTSPITVTGPLTDTQLRASAVPVSAASLPLPTGAATEATLLALSEKSAGALVPEKYDELEITYVGSTTDIDTVTYKLASTTVATLQLSYDIDNRLVGVVKT